ncbi:bifunctional triacylglycerol lipase/ester hydrolase [Aspergillus homomorphus CBS 101889]|uniref:Lipid droplet-associated hydrolase n=1 Tax=Aspergillus homomorphus (strain CBS 101889) TaxID=1450537 RepID=A0A395I3C1_ASPHC|nr:hypothetical protein BO97DRAFT_386633 [Aspergillus homomorphus CBS 101889]RAL14199.1 hypothetical protein BO97DRAFT_386633 [Aspergillus homomorphus CBS 101889]
MSPPIDPHMTPDSFFHTLSAKKPSSSSPVLIYFISGNPGLISYYYPFFTHLIEKLKPLVSEHNGNPTIHLHGHSLAGFEVSASGDSASAAEPYYHDLEDQIRFVQHKLDECVTGIANAASTPTPKPRIILIGHSVGTYMAMELIRRHRERTSSSSTDAFPTFDIISGILLFPTVVDIAKSPSGRKLTTLLSFLPHLALIASFFARALTTLLPGFLLRGLVALVMGSPPQEAVDTTVAFLRSRRGVRQALHMAASEMYSINSDEWADEVWGISSDAGSSEALAKLFFYYGREDHWVAEETREEILALRGKATEGRGPTMVVCEEGSPHAFCLRHSEVMAAKVAEMVKEVVG